MWSKIWGVCRISRFWCKLSGLTDVFWGGGEANKDLPCWLYLLIWYRFVHVTNSIRIHRIRQQIHQIFLVSGLLLIKHQFHFYSLFRLYYKQEDDIDNEYESRPHFCPFNLPPDRHWKGHCWYVTISYINAMDDRNMADNDKDMHWHKARYWHWWQQELVYGRPLPSLVIRSTSTSGRPNFLLVPIGTMGPWSMFIWASIYIFVFWSPHCTS